MTEELKKLQSLRGKFALFYDTETTGVHDSDHIVQLAWVLVRIPVTGGTMEEVGSASTILFLPCGVEVPSGAFRVHGIDADMALACGVEPFVALHMLIEAANRADVRVAHNQDFDDRMIGAAIVRENSRPQCLYDLESMSSLFFGVRKCCTMQLSSPVLSLPSTPRMIRAGFGGKPKAPKLEEAFRHFSGRELEGAHDALADVRGTMAVFQGLLDLGAGESEA